MNIPNRQKLYALFWAETGEFIAVYKTPSHREGAIKQMQNHCNRGYPVLKVDYTMDGGSIVEVNPKKD